MSTCLFCKIITREIPGAIVYEDDRLLAFNDINPQAPTHVLVIPRKELTSLSDASELDEQLLGHLLLIAGKIARQEGLTAGG